MNGDGLDERIVMLENIIDQLREQGHADTVEARVVRSVLIGLRRRRLMQLVDWEQYAETMGRRLDEHFTEVMNEAILSAADQETTNPPSIEDIRAAADTLRYGAPMSAGTSARMLIIDDPNISSVSEMYKYIDAEQEGGRDIEHVRVVVSVAKRIVANTPTLEGNLTKVVPGAKLFGIRVV